MAGNDPMSLDTLLQRVDIWRGGEHSLRDRGVDGAAIATDIGALDEALPGGGWPLGALTELLVARPGIGELQLVLPALARLSQEGRWLVWIAPPHLPYAPALASAGVDLARLLLVRPADARGILWSAEQALRSRACGAVLAWPRSVNTRRLRRLQLAAETGKTLGLLFRSLSACKQPSPAALRIQLKAATTDLQLHILKRRAARSTRPIVLSRSITGR